jgi:hypothetical protein
MTFTTRHSIYNLSNTSGELDISVKNAFVTWLSSPHFLSMNLDVTHIYIYIYMINWGDQAIKDLLTDVHIYIHHHHAVGRDATKTDFITWPLLSI